MRAGMSDSRWHPRQGPRLRTGLTFGTMTKSMRTDLLRRQQPELVAHLRCSSRVAGLRMQFAVLHVCLV